MAVRLDRMEMPSEEMSMPLACVRRHTHLEFLLFVFQSLLGVILMLDAHVDRVYKRQNERQPDVVAQRCHGVEEPERSTYIRLT